jgi:hypothetical protein
MEYFMPEQLSLKDDSNGFSYYYFYPINTCQHYSLSLINFEFIDFVLCEGEACGQL